MTVGGDVYILTCKKGITDVEHLGRLNYLQRSHFLLLHSSSVSRQMQSAKKKKKKNGKFYKGINKGSHRDYQFAIFNYSNWFDE